MLEEVTDEERRAVAGLLGRKDRGAASLTVSPTAVEATLRRAGICDDLLSAVLTLTGPVSVRADERARHDHARTELVEILAGCRHASEPWFAEWSARLAADGTLTKAVRRGGGVVRQARVVLDLLPAASPIPISVLAERATGDTKALAGTPLDRLVLRALAARISTPVETTSEGRRALWESAGVIVDDLASQVLVLGLRATGSALADWLNAAADTATPFRVTLHQLVTMPLLVTTPRVFVCENPAVLRAAVTVPGAALICTEGIPSLACHRLVAACAGEVWWRGDFDWTGVRTTAEAQARYGATPWRMDMTTYRHALGRGESEALKGSSADSPWAPELAAHMAVTARAVMEERLIGELLEDLAEA
ncbi:TIGR02679 family protein [Nonomuraea lactucae]|uniref:TIGR02679 family protein n=1 Tax=Nonomuraea lactucae TaxID=2249762 RepID=UPI001F05A86C|nr:TIGR02679 family protein [Nonomuraea lactucae]